MFILCQASSPVVFILWTYYRGWVVRDAQNNGNEQRQVHKEFMGKLFVGEIPLKLGDERALQAKAMLVLVVVGGSWGGLASRKVRQAGRSGTAVDYEMQQQRVH